MMMSPVIRLVSLWSEQSSTSLSLNDDVTSEQISIVVVRTVQYYSLSLNDDVTSEQICD